MKKKIIALIVVILVAGAGAWWWKAKKKTAQTKKMSNQFVTVSVGDISETVDATGEVSPLNRVEIKPPIQGRIEKLQKDEGDRVERDTILGWMSSSDRAAILDAARAQGPDQVKQWEDAYKPTPILAPLSGLIILRNVVVGQTVDSSTILFAMSDKLIVLAQVDEADIGRVRVGMKARITLDAYPDQPVEGSVFQILHEGKNVSNVITYGVKIQLKKIPDFFRSQMTANVTLAVKERSNVLLVPSQAVQTNRQGEKQILMRGPDEKPVPVEVTTGLDNGEQVEIVSGLNEGDTILISRTAYSPQKNAPSSPLAGGTRPGGGSGSGSGSGSGRRQ